MNYEQIQILEEKTKQVHHDLANALISISMVRQKFEAWPPERRAKYEILWESTYVNALESLTACLDLFDK